MNADHREPEPRECCATTTDCHHLDDCAERPAAEFLGRFQDDGGSASSTEKGHLDRIIPTEAYDAEHPDHGWYVERSGHCYAGCADHHSTPPAGGES